MSKKTIPMSPRLMTRTRTRPTEFAFFYSILTVSCLFRVIGFEERENMEVAEMKANQFKARPLPKYVCYFYSYFML